MQPCSKIGGPHVAVYMPEEPCSAMRMQILDSDALSASQLKSNLSKH